MARQSSAYTPSQIALYNSYSSLPSQFHLSASPALDLSLLTALHTHQIAAVPYENLTLHYSSHHTVSLDPQSLFKKIVTDKRGRGGYCMENSILFNHILRAYGFDVYVTGVRTRPRVDGVPEGKYIGWVHIVNIVTLHTTPTPQRYMVDVSFGGNGPTLPLPLTPSLVHTNLGTQQDRLLYDTIPQFANPGSKIWIYQCRNSVDKAWNSFYCFGEEEWLDGDFEIINFFTSQSTTAYNFQTKTVVVVKFLMGKREDEGSEAGEGIVGKVMLVNGEVKDNRGGKTKLIKVCKTECERVEALRDYFGIELTDEEREGIKGRVVELGA
ncbi:hypothetical protein B7494_g3299 [Chlorociboria aeruginascens]|nr:hypothetical protein B7494_g3299 [Chlorociboria aeruginascens]